MLAFSHPVLLDAVPTTMDKILGGAQSAIDFSGKCLEAMVNNPVYLFFLAAGLVGVGLALVRKLRSTAKG